MTRLFYLLITYTILIIPIEAQFGSVKIEFDDRLLRSDERYDLINLKEDIRQFKRQCKNVSLQSTFF